MPIILKITCKIILFPSCDPSRKKREEVEKKVMITCPEIRLFFSFRQILQLSIHNDGKVKVEERDRLKKIQYGACIMRNYG